MTGRGWVGVDLDSTLAHYEKWTEEIGEPIEPMVERVCRVLDDGTYDVKIMTARARDPLMVEKIQAWCLKVFGEKLEVTDRKDYLMVELWDDRAFNVVANTGEFLGAVTTPVLAEIELRLLWPKE